MKKSSMKKLKKLLKNNIKLIIGIIIGIILSCTGVYAATILYASNNVGYDNTTSGLTSTNVQDALDELDTKANVCSNSVTTAMTMSMKYKYATDAITSNTTTGLVSNLSTISQNVFVGKYNEMISVCIRRNGTVNCFFPDDLALEKTHMQNKFSDITCSKTTNQIDCDASDFRCRVYNYGGGLSVENGGMGADCWYKAENIGCSIDHINPNSGTNWSYSGHCGQMEKVTDECYMIGEDTTMCYY